MQKVCWLFILGRESIKLGPPLTITKDALIEALEVIDESIQEVLR